MQLNVVPHRNIRQPPGILLREIRNHAELMRKQEPIRNANTKHEERHGLTFAAFAAKHAQAISLRIYAPPAQIVAPPFRGNGIVAQLGELPDFLQALPRILFLFQPFRAQSSFLSVEETLWIASGDPPYSL